MQETKANQSTDFVLTRLRRLEDRLKALAEKTSTKLQPLLINMPSEETTKCEPRPLLPPLFEEIDAISDRISNFVEVINHTIDEVSL